MKRIQRIVQRGGGKKESLHINLPVVWCIDLRISAGTVLDVRRVKSSLVLTPVERVAE